MQNLIEFYPEHFHNKVFKELVKAQQIELEKEEKAIDLLINEFFIDTAIFSLPIWAKFAGIEDNIDLEIDIRRNNIKAALKSQDITTVEVIKKITESYNNGTCEVIENYSDYSFTIKFIDIIGVPKRIDEIKKIIDKVKPAHLAYDFEFKFHTWNDIKNTGKTWEDWKKSGKTWNDLKGGIL